MPPPGAASRERSRRWPAKWPGGIDGHRGAPQPAMARQVAARRLCGYSPALMTLPRLRHLLAASLAAAFCAGCPETLQVQCPVGTAPAGGFTLTFTAQDSADFCRVIALADGGAADAAAAVPPGPLQATLCSSAAD